MPLPLEGTLASMRAKHGTPNQYAARERHRECNVANVVER